MNGGRGWQTVISSNTKGQETLAEHWAIISISLAPTYANVQTGEKTGAAGRTGTHSGQLSASNSRLVTYSIGGTSE